MARWTAKKVRKARPAKRRRYKVIERSPGRTFSDGSRLPARRKVTTGTGSIVEALSTWMFGVPQHGGRSRGRSWW
jgi:hypothetical protein